jgi:hypothetical protein
VDAELCLRPSVKLSGLPEKVQMRPGQRTIVIDNIAADAPADVTIDVIDATGMVLTRSNPLRIAAKADLLAFWGDLHAQSEETIGTNSAQDFFSFGRDLAFLDVIGHQGNDFQITGSFWSDLNRLSAAANRDGSFVTLPGYEWSGNTGLGGDRNVYFADEGRPIRRSSHALVADRADISMDCTTAAELFETLRAEGENAVCFAHCGGRYADVKLAHDGIVERSMEVHSAWGTFEWLVRDAFEMGYRVGIVANSDGHKGRPGAEWPGASLFGAHGGLTCLRISKLDRRSVFECLRQRRHYATSGARLHLEVDAAFEREGTLYHDDPRLGPAHAEAAVTAMMGDIVHLPQGGVTLKVQVVGSAPIERLDIFNGLDHLETLRPYSAEELGNRIRVLWEGAAYRGRFRQVIWDGRAQVSDNNILDARPINFFNPDKKLERVDGKAITWKALTTGNFGGFDCWLADAYAGTLEIDTPLVKCGVPLEDIGLDDELFEAGGLDRRLRIFRMPKENHHQSFQIERTIALKPSGDNPIYVRVTQEDGHQAWSSPIYLYR